MGRVLCALPVPLLSWSVDTKIRSRENTRSKESSQQIAWNRGSTQVFTESYRSTPCVKGWTWIYLYTWKIPLSDLPESAFSRGFRSKSNEITDWTSESLGWVIVTSIPGFDEICNTNSARRVEVEVGGGRGTCSRRDGDGVTRLSWPDKIRLQLVSPTMWGAKTRMNAECWCHLYTHARREIQNTKRKREKCKQRRLHKEETS